jgi:hypothetical protein
MSKKTLTFEEAFEQLCSESRSLGYRYMLRDLEPQFRRIWDAATATAQFPPRAVGEVPMFGIEIGPVPRPTPTAKRRGRRPARREGDE